MRRFLTLVCIFGLAVPAGISITGCTRNPAAKYCSITTGYGELTTAVTSVILQPQQGGISLAYGQTRQASTPSAYTCTGAGANVASNHYTYGTSNNQLVDISPTGNICAGTWNRNTGGGIPDYTICNYPKPSPSTGGLPYGSANITATAESVTSNPVTVYVHAPVTSVALVGPQSCLSQTDTAQLDAEACFTGSNGQQQLLCAPSLVTTSASPNLACPLPIVNGQQVALSSIPTCESSIGAMSFSVATASVAKINSTNNQITALAPGTTAITASIAGSGSSAGYFSTCPPESINVTLANGATSGTITQGVQQNLSTTVKDTNGNAITGLTLDYQSTNPIDITASTGGAVSTTYPGVASITAICQPPSCNPAPINEVGLYGTGLPISSGPVTVTTPGTTSNYVFFASPGNSQYFVPYAMLTNTLGSTVRLPYVPNSMVMDQQGSNLYFGSLRELMVYSTTNDTLTKQDTSVPGVVLAVSPNNSQVLINDQVRQLFYLYNASGGGYTTFGGLGVAAEWTPDSQTLYIVDSTSANNPAEGITGHTNTLYVYNVFTGWSTYDLSASGGATSVAVTVPSVGAYLSGNSTVAHTWCPSGTVGNAASITYYPLGDSVNVQTNVLAATTGGRHILGAGLVGGAVTLDDLGVTIPATACTVTTSGSTQTMQPLVINHDPVQTLPVNISATSLNQIVASPVSDLAFLTYDGTTTGAQLPYYLPTAPGSAGTLSYVTLSGDSAITGPVAGAFSPDDNTFFVSTAGDNQIHLITIPKGVSTANPPTDTLQISPNLPACTPVSAGGVDADCTYTGTSSVVPATVITVIPRATT
jgi:trimeric autotransporter adhesin